MNLKGILISFSIAIIAINTFALFQNNFVTANSNSRGYQTGYPPPFPIPTPGNIIESRKIFLPQIGKPVAVPMRTFSYYIDGVYQVNGQDVFYYMGCDKGNSDRLRSGEQNSIVYLDFGEADWEPDENGDATVGAWHYGNGFMSVVDISEHLFNFAYGYYQCLLPDNDNDQIIVAASINNNHSPKNGADQFVYEHGIA
jgi:hypothetical protein